MMGWELASPNQFVTLNVLTLSGPLCVVCICMYVHLYDGVVLFV